jgi:hypothetical protein
MIVCCRGRRSALCPTQARQHGSNVLHLSGDVDEHGVWAGVQGVLESVLPRIRCSVPTEWNAGEAAAGKDASW